MPATLCAYGRGHGPLLQNDGRQHVASRKYPAFQVKVPMKK